MKLRDSVGAEEFIKRLETHVDELFPRLPPNIYGVAGPPSFRVEIHIIAMVSNLYLLYLIFP